MQGNTWKGWACGALAITLWVPVLGFTLRIGTSGFEDGCSALPSAFLLFSLGLCIALGTTLGRIYVLSRPPVALLRSLVATRSVEMALNDAILTGIGVACAGYVAALGVLALGGEEGCGPNARTHLFVLLIGWALYGPFSCVALFLATESLGKDSTLPSKDHQATRIWSLPCVLALAGIAFLLSFAVFLIAFFIGSAHYI